MRYSSAPVSQQRLGDADLKLQLLCARLVSSLAAPAGSGAGIKTAPVDLMC